MEECIWARLFCFQHLHIVRQQLCTLNAQLEPCPPVFPERALLHVDSVLQGCPEMMEQVVDALCYQLLIYLG